MLPPDFSAEEYRDLHADLQWMDPDQLRQHYIQHGKSEGRKYRKDTEKFLLVHSSFHYYHLTPPYDRQLLPTHANGFMNQIQGLLCAVQIAAKMGRTLVVDGFYPDICDKTLITPLSKIVDISSLDCRYQDLSEHDISRFHVSHYAHQMIHRPKHEWLDDVQRIEGHYTYLEIDCCITDCP